MTVRPIQFRLRSMLIVLSGCCIAFAFWPQLWEVYSRNYRAAAVVVPTLLAAGGFLMGRILAQAACNFLLLRFVRILLWPAFGVVILGCVYLAWVRHRVLWEWPLDPNWPRPWPYPDAAITLLHDWLDARNPPAPGMIKIEGEYYQVLGLIDLTVISLIGVAAMLAGVLNPRLPRQVVESRGIVWLMNGIREEVFPRLFPRNDREAD